MGSSQTVDNLARYPTIENKQDFIFEAGQLNDNTDQNIESKYTLINPPLGRGIFGQVYKAKHKKTGVYRAVRRVRKYKLKSHQQQHFQEQVLKLKRLDHPNIIKVHEFYQTESDYYIVVELCTGGEFLGLISQNQKFSEHRAAELMSQILRSLQYCHKQNVFHGGLKPESILFASRLPNCCIKISDFGIQRDYTKLQVGSDKFGTPYYLAPELLIERGDYKSDIWACGVILYMMISGRLPFCGRTDQQTLMKIIEGKLDLSKGFLEASAEVKDLIGKMLEPKKSIRYSSRDCLNHPWFYRFSNKEIQVTVLKKAFKNIKKYTISSKLQEVIWIHMISMFSSPEQIEELLEVFKSLDSDDDGCLTRLELKTGFMRIESSEEAEQSVKRLEKMLGKETMSFSQFLRCSIHPSTIIVESNIQKMFQMFDQDGNTQISIGELHKIMGNNKLISVSLLEDFMRQADADSDGTISSEEFKILIGDLLAKQPEPRRTSRNEDHRVEEIYPTQE